MRAKLLMLRPVALGFLFLTGILQAAIPSRPNVLVIITDQQHAGMMSCTGNSDLKTPNLDALASRGVRFEQAYVTNPVCIPSRFSLMTSTMPSVIGMESNDDSTCAVPANILSSTLGEVFRRAGYQTVYAGKKHLPGQDGVFDDPKAYGFDEILVPRDNNGRDAATDACVKFIQEPHDKPFVLYASLVNPHDICYMLIRDYLQHMIKVAPGPAKRDGFPAQGFPKNFPALVELDNTFKLPPGMTYDGFVEEMCPPLPANFEIPDYELSAMWTNKGEFMFYGRYQWTKQDWRAHRWAYARLTERVDGQIGRLLDALKAAGLSKDTLIVFTADHGEQDGAHRSDEKAFLYQESVRIPLLVTWEGVTKPGLVDETHLVSNGLDMLPTICDFAGVPVPAGAKGRSVRALTTGDSVKDWRNHLVVESGLSRLVTMGRWKYMVGNARVTQTRVENGTLPFVVREAVVDLQTDPGEMKNLAGKASARPVLEEGRRLLKEWYKDHDLALDPNYVVDAR